MKKLYFITIVLLCMMIVFQSCSKQSTNHMIAPASPNVINAKIAPNQTYLFNVNSSGDVSIEKQALHYKISKIAPDAKSGQMVYEYLPAQGYIGADEVVLSRKITIYTSGGGGRCNSNYNDNSVTTSYSTSYTTIRLTIAN